jgi:hypothetical protein
MYWISFALGVIVGTMFVFSVLSIISKLRTHFAKSKYDIAF